MKILPWFKLLNLNQKVSLISYLLVPYIENKTKPNQTYLVYYISNKKNATDFLILGLKSVALLRHSSHW